MDLDVAIQFANVNGTGSASANSLIAKTLFRMGWKIGAKNMFPSNIQGMPTWFEIRANPQGYTARKGRIDVMVAMNQQSYDQDALKMDPDGYWIVDPAGRSPQVDCTVLELPVFELVRERFPQARNRPLLQNVVYD